MLTIAKLFGKSPFAPLQTHMDKVSACIDQLPALFKALADNDEEKIKIISAKISKLEHEADLTKNDIRNHLPKSLFMPIDRESLLEILSLQDAFADKAEDIGILVTLKKLDNFSQMQADLDEFTEKNIQTFYLAKEVISEFDSLLETTFGGSEAQKVKEMTERLAFHEHEVDRLQYNIMKKLYSIGDEMHFTSFSLWLVLFKEIGSISNISENLGNRIRMLLEIN